MKKQKILILLVAIIVILIVALNSFGENNDIYKIGYIGPETGPSAVLGMDAVAALQIAVEEVNEKGGINGKQVELIVEDDKYLTKDTVNAYNKLVNVDKVDVILAANYGGVFAIAEQAQKDDVIVIDPLDCNDELAGLNDNIFCLATETESIGDSLADYMIAKGDKKAAVMYSTKDTFMVIVADVFTEKFESAGGEVMVEEFNYDDSDFRTQLLKIKSENPEGLVILGHDEQGIIMKQARELGVLVPFYTTGTITSPVAQ